MQPYPPQQPPPRPPYGQVPYGWPPVPPAPPPPPKRKAPWIVAGIAIAVVLGVLAFVVANNKHEWLHDSGERPSAAIAGDCIKVNSASTTDADVEKIDCTSPDAVYQVGTKEDGDVADCPSDSYDKYTQSGRGDEFTLCLMLNAREGDCFSHVTSGTTAKVACSAADAEARTDKVVDGQAAQSACPDDTGLVLVYPEPGETVCLNEVTGA